MGVVSDQDVVLWVQKQRKVQAGGLIEELGLDTGREIARRQDNSEIFAN